MRRVERVILIWKNCLVNHARFKGHILCRVENRRENTMSSKEDFQSGYRLETKATCNWSTGKKR